MIRRVCAAFLIVLLPVLSLAQDKSFGLSAPQGLTDTGLLDYVVPRFSLKTGIRIVINGDADHLRLNAEHGVAVFERGDVVWRMTADDTPLPRAFADWITSDVGRRTIEAFEPVEGARFTASVPGRTTSDAPDMTGDIVAGETLGLSLCGRCHVVNKTNRMKAIGSTPSFAVLRTFDDWAYRFEVFYVLKPHGAFTQVDGVTEPFADNLPSPIAPVELTQDDLDAIIAYVATLTPADLGRPVQSQ